MEAVWYYVVNGVQTGPVSWGELKQAASAGKLSPNDLVWKEGTSDWAAARTVADLFPAVPFTPPQPPPPSAASTYDLSPPLPPPPAHPAAEETLPLPASPVRKPPSLDDAPTEPSKSRRTRPRERDRDRVSAALPSGTPEWAKPALMFLRRAFHPDPAQVPPTPDEEASLTRSGVMDATARTFAVWRRAVLFVAAVPSALTAIFVLISLLAAGSQSLSAFGLLLLSLRAFALFALPVAAVFGARAYDRLSVSTKWVLIGGLIALVVPLGVTLVPSDWFIDLEVPGATPIAQVEATKSQFAFRFALTFALLLLPVILSLLPALTRACLWMKMLLPESPVPGWGLVTHTPLCALLILAMSVFLYQVVGNVLLLIVLLLWFGAPLLCLVQFNRLTRPTISPADRAALATAWLRILGVILFSGLLLVIFLLTAKQRVFSPDVEPKKWLGFDSDTSVFRPWNLGFHKYWLEAVGWGLFLSVFFSDLILRISLSMWRASRGFVGSAEAANFDRTMTSLDSALLPRGSTPT